MASRWAGCRSFNGMCASAGVECGSLHAQALLRPRVAYIPARTVWSSASLATIARSHLTKLLAARSILDLDFEWDDIKAAENLRHHGVSFAQAALAFRDPFAVEWIGLREAHGEERIILLGMTGNQVLTVVYTERAERIRIISARRATRNEQDLYYRENAT